MVIWSRFAKEDLKQIYNYIARDSKYYAQKVVNNIVERSEMLVNFPEIGRMVPEINDVNVREMLIYSYRLICEISSNRIEVLALIHSKRNFESGNLDDLRN